MARSFNGTTDQCIPGVGVAPIISSGTIAGWVKRNNTTRAGSQDPLWAAWIFTPSVVRQSYIYIQAGTSVIQVDIPFVTAVITGATSITAGNWFHFAVTVNSRSWVLYVNGVSDGAATAGLDPDAGNPPVSIGYSAQNTQVTLDGSMADVGLWSSVLTANEVLGLARGQRPYMVRQSTLLGYWPLDGRASPEPDLSGKGNNGVLSGTTIAAGPPETLFTPKWVATPNASTPPTITPRNRGVIFGGGALLPAIIGRSILKNRSASKRELLSPRWWLKSVVFAACLLAASEASAQITPGTASNTYLGVTQVQMSASEALTGGSFTYQWYRDTSPGTPTNALSGKTDFTLVDTTASAGTTYYYAMKYSDGVNTPVFTPQVQVTTLAASKLLVMGGIGDSIMDIGGNTCVGSDISYAHMLDLLNTQTSGKWQWVDGGNEAVSGTQSHSWADATPGDALNLAAIAFAASGVTNVVIMLGANDPGQGTTNANYKSNMQTITSYLFANVPTLKYINLMSPLWQNGGNNIFLEGYAAQLPSVANGSTIFNTIPLDGYNYFQANTAQLCDGLHPGTQGAYTLGAMWANGIMNDPAYITSGRFLFR